MNYNQGLDSDNVKQDQAFGRWVAMQRQVRQLKLQELAALTRLRVDFSTIGKIEHLHTQATMPTAIRIAQALGSTPVHLIYEALLAPDDVRLDLLILGGNPAYEKLENKLKA